MTQQWGVPAWLAIAAAIALVVALVAIGVAVTMLAGLNRANRAQLSRAEAAAADLRARVDALERRLSAQRRGAPADEGEFVITEVGAHPPAEPDRTPAPAITAPLFADLVLRESVVQAASLGAGLRRAMEPGSRHRIRLEMRREIKRSRRQRRRDLRAARREWSAAPPASSPAQDDAAADTAA